MFVPSPLQWVMDFIICNGLGIYLGMKTCEYLSMKVSLRGWGEGMVVIKERYGMCVLGVG